MQPERRMVRNALLLLLEDPPLGLGDSDLAHTLLPHEGDKRLRGLAVQRILHQAIAQLQPAQQQDARAWWAYAIYRGEYEEGRTRQDVRDTLAISAPTYTLAKQHGMSKILDVLPRLAGQHAEETREELLYRLLGGNVVGAMGRLRTAVKRYAHNPHSPTRQSDLIQRLEEVMAEQVNHLYSVCGTLVTGPIERMQEDNSQQQREIEMLRLQLAELAFQVASLPIEHTVDQ